MSDGVFWPEFEQWLLAHGIDPIQTAQVAWTPGSTHQPAVDGDGPAVSMQVTTFKLRDGRRYLDKGEIATETRLVPMRHLPAVEIIRHRPAG